MGRAPCCDKATVKRGPWSPEEDTTLKNYLHKNGPAGNWIALPHKAGLKRCGKSCRLRWLNYLRPDIKHGGFTEEEDNTILTLYANIGSRWSVIASHMPGRTDNDVKNHWNTKLKKKALFAGKSLNNCNIPNKNNSMQYFSLTKLVPKSETQYYGNSDFPPMNSSIFPYQVDMNYHQIQFPPPKLTQLQENYATSSTAYSKSFTTVPLIQEISLVSPSFSLENSNYASRSSDGGGQDDEFLVDLGYADLLNGFDFHEKISEFGGHVVNSTYSSLLPNISDTDPSQGFYPKVAN